MDKISQVLVGTLTGNKIQYSSFHKQNREIASLGRQEPAGTVKWATTLRSGRILGTISVAKSIQNP